MNHEVALAFSSIARQSIEIARQLAKLHKSCEGSTGPIASELANATETSIAAVSCVAQQMAIAAKTAQHAEIQFQNPSDQQSLVADVQMVANGLEAAGDSAAKNLERSSLLLGVIDPDIFPTSAENAVHRTRKNLIEIEDLLRLLGVKYSAASAQMQTIADSIGD